MKYSFVLSLKTETLTLFRDAIRSQVTRPKYEKPLEQFLVFAVFTGDLTQKARILVEHAEDTAWATESSWRTFAFTERKRRERDFLLHALNFYKSIKLLLEMNDVSLNWMKITRGVPKIGSVAQDRAPSIEEIRKLLEYPDRRIKPIELIMISSEFGSEPGITSDEDTFSR